METDLNVLVESSLRSFFIVEGICDALEQRDVPKVESLWRDLEDLRDTVRSVESHPQEILEEMNLLMSTVEKGLKNWISVNSGKS